MRQLERQRGEMRTGLRQYKGMIRLWRRTFVIRVGRVIETISDHGASNGLNKWQRAYTG